jgi:hypothetical protein
MSNQATPTAPPQQPAELDALRRRVADLEQLVRELGSRLDGLAEHTEHRFHRHHERIEAVDDDARRRDRDRELELDRVRDDVRGVERSVEQAGRGW